LAWSNLVQSRQHLSLFCRNPDTPVHSTSSLSINWIPPDLTEERWEFFNHPAKQDFYRRYGITWELLTAAAADGCLVPYPRGAAIAGVPVNLAHHTYDDYCRYLAKAKRGYRQNYNRMETALQREGMLTLPAAIVIGAGSDALLFSGYRRLCLAWNYGMVPYVWLVTVESPEGPGRHNTIRTGSMECSDSEA
jgi:hypothetical protein